MGLIKSKKKKKNAWTGSKPIYEFGGQIRLATSIIKYAYPTKGS